MRDVWDALTLDLFFFICYHSVPNLSRENREAVLGYDPITKSHIFSYSLFVPLCQAIKVKQS